MKLAKIYRALNAKQAFSWEDAFYVCPFVMQGRVGSPTSLLSSSCTSLAGLHTSSVIHSRSTDRIPLHISTSDTPICQWHARSPRLSEPASAANASADTSHQMDSPLPAGIPILKERAYTKLGTVGSRLCFAG